MYVCISLQWSFNTFSRTTGNETHSKRSMQTVFTLTFLTETHSQARGLPAAVIYTIAAHFLCVLPPTSKQKL